jgi:hypothetical protein
MKDTPASATSGTEKLEIVLPFDRSTVRISPIWVLYTVSPWLNLLSHPVVRPLDATLIMLAGDVFNYTQMIHLTAGNKVESTLCLYLCYKADRAKALSQSGTVAIDGKYYFFDPHESEEDVRLYEYSLDSSVLEPPVGSGGSGEPESG